MRIISNKELGLVGGGAVQQVEVKAKRMTWWEDIMYDMFEDGSNGGMTMADHNILQRAYVVANDTGRPVQVDVSRPVNGYEVSVGPVKVTGSTGEIQFSVTVDPADCYKRP